MTGRPCVHTPRHTLVLTTFVIAALGGCKQSSSGPSSTLVDQVFAEYNNPRSPGCSVAISRNGAIVYEHGYGMANLEWNIPITPTTVMGAASISKQFTAMSILLLAQRGKLSLDGDISKYVPDWADHEHHVTIRHLLTHTSGLREGFGLLGLAGQTQSNEAMERMLARQHGVNTPAGTEFVYNNGAYNLLASIVKRVSGQSLRDFAEANIFRPLGMAHTQFRDDAALLIASRAAGYTADEDGVDANAEAVVVGNSGLYTTPHDLLLWENNFDNPRVGTPELLAEMQKPAVLNNGKPTQYGFGLFLMNYRGQRTVEHSGGGSGISSNLVRYPDQKLAIALQCNSDAIDPNVLTNKIADVYLADVLTKLPPAQPTAPRVTLSAADLSSAAGLYRGVSDKDPSDLRVSVRDGKWIGHSFFRGGSDFELNPVDARHARGPFGVRMFEFIPGVAGHPRAVHIRGPAGDTDFVLTAYIPQAAELRPFGGQYWSDELQVAFTVLARDSGLMIQLPGQAPSPLQPFEKDAFLGPGILTFTRDTHGAVTGFILDHSSVRKLSFRRMQPVQ
ncbi:MAG: beta-lactamase family protein [Acidobacteriia bacterium]|nr:beta-lactamase family protein [Terriglobia bacterium]